MHHYFTFYVKTWTFPYVPKTASQVLLTF